MLFQERSASFRRTCFLWLSSHLSKFELPVHLIIQSIFKPFCYPGVFPLGAWVQMNPWTLPHCIMHWPFKVVFFLIILIIFKSKLNFWHMNTKNINKCGVDYMENGAKHMIKPFKSILSGKAPILTCMLKWQWVSGTFLFHGWVI